MRKLPLTAFVALGFAALAGFLVVPQDDEGEWSEEGITSFIGVLEKAADSAASVGDFACDSVLRDAAAGYGFANGGVFNKNDLYSGDSDNYGLTRHEGQITTIWIDDDSSPNVIRTRIWEGLRASLRGENTRGIFKDWRKDYNWWWSDECWEYVSKADRYDYIIPSGAPFDAPRRR